MQNPLYSFVLSAAPVLAGGAAHAEVFTVGGGNPDFAEIADAVAAARDGDTIQVRDGFYDHFAVVDKELTIVGVGPAVRVQGLVRLRNLSAAKHLVLSRIEFRGSGDVTLRAYDNSGLVTLQGCKVVAPPADLTECLPVAYPGAVVENCGGVSFVDCEVSGGWGPTYEDGLGYCQQSDGAVALVVAASNVAIHGGEVRGGRGSFIDDVDESAGSGNDGILVMNGADLWLSDVLVEGGDGGNGGDPLFTCGGWGGDGGDAVDARTGATVRALGASFVPGLGGPSGDPGCVDPDCDFDCPQEGDDGQGQRLGGGATFEDLAGEPRRLALPMVAFDDQAVMLQVHGQPGDRVAIAFSRGAHWAPRPRGVFLLGGLLLAPTRYVGTVGSGGMLARRVPLLGTPDGTAYDLGAQALCVDSLGERTLTEARWITVR